MLILVVITMSLVSLIAVASAENSRTLITVAGREREATRARLGADSALAYTERQLVLDNDWSGSGEWVDLGNFSFLASRVPSQPGADAVFTLSAKAGASRVELIAEFEIGSNAAPSISHAMAFLGGSVDMNSTKVTNAGDVIIIDDAELVLDWDPDTEQFAPMGGDDPEIDANSVEIDGDLYINSGELSGVDANDIFALENPTVNPRWNLDRYLEPNDDTIIYYGQHNFNHITTDKTVVIVPTIGKSINFNNCDIKGGVVIWSPPDFEQRGMHRNKIVWNSCSFGTDSDNPSRVNQHVGMIAPNCRLTNGNSLDAGKGLFYFHEIWRINSAKIEGGALWSTNRAKTVNSVDIEWNPELANMSFPGFLGAVPYVKLTQLRELYDSP